EMWVRSMLPMLGKLTFILGAYEGDALQGFLSGTIRTMPPHFGGHKVGSFNYIYLEPTVRSAGLGKRLMEALADEFAAKGITHFEGDVLPGNVASKAFLEKIGWTVDHLV